MPHIKRILFPVDFSDSCLNAARYVELFAGQFEAEIIRLHVVGMGEHNLAEELLPGRQAQLDAFLTDELKYFATLRICIPGDASSAITETARSWNPDLVMMPTHGLGFFRRHLLGSTTAKTIHDVDCPIWTTVHQETPPKLENMHCRRILCAVDLTERSASVMEWTAWLAAEFQAELGFVHATISIDVAPSVARLGEEFRQYLAEKSRHIAAHPRKQINLLQPQSVRLAPVFVSPGDPADVICKTASAFGADLLVIGRHDQSGITDSLLQHAFAILRNSPCPVVSI
jgi:nucleotide-binding universal stress UspA family protein